MDPMINTLIQEAALAGVAAWPMAATGGDTEKARDARDGETGFPSPSW
jgi:hypothetical protein